MAGRVWVEAFVERYLSPGHLNKPEDGCPLPALVSEIARSGGPAKASFEAIVRDLSARLQGQAGGELAEDRALASSPSALVGSASRDRSGTRPSASASLPHAATWPGQDWPPVPCPGPRHDASQAKGDVRRNRGLQLIPDDFSCPTVVHTT